MFPRTGFPPQSSLPHSAEVSRPRFSTPRAGPSVKPRSAPSHAPLHWPFHSHLRPAMKYGSIIFTPLVAICHLSPSNRVSWKYSVNRRASRPVVVVVFNYNDRYLVCSLSKSIQQAVQISDPGRTEAGGPRTEKLI